MDEKIQTTMQELRDAIRELPDAIKGSQEDFAKIFWTPDKFPRHFDSRLRWITLSVSEKSEKIIFVSPNVLFIAHNNKQAW